MFLIKWVIKLTIMPLIPFVALGDCLIWNATHAGKTNIQTSFAEIVSAWERW